MDSFLINTTREEVSRHAVNIKSDIKSDVESVKKA